MKKRSLSSSSSSSSSPSLTIPHTTLITTIDSSPSSSSSSSSSSSASASSCVVDYDDHNQNNNNKTNEQNDEDEKPPKAKKTRKKRALVNPKNEENCSNANANKRSSIYRGVTRHRWTGRYEAHLWDKSSWNNMQNKKGKQVYLGAYDSEVDAARTYDLAALKYWGPETTLNFGIDNYSKDVEEMKNVSKEEYLASLRRRSSGFSRGVSKYRGVARHHHNGRWEARIGRVFGNKYLYLGTFGSQEEAAAAYDMAAIEYRGANAVTNFDISNYIGLVKNLTPKDPSQSPNPGENEPKQKHKQQKKQHRAIKPEKHEEQQCEKEVEQEQEQQEQEEEIVMPSAFEESKLISPIDLDHSSLLEMATDDAEGENPWSFCLENGEFDPLLFPDIPLPEDGRRLNMFEQISFEDNIDLIFEGEGLSISMDDIYSYGTDMETKAPTELVKKMENSIYSSSSFPPSPASTTSLVSCQVLH